MSNVLLFLLIRYCKRICLAETLYTYEHYHYQLYLSFVFTSAIATSPLPYEQFLICFFLFAIVEHFFG